jgi:hypothetical protein
MRYEFPIQPSREYLCPKDAGPAWRKACEAGFDMAELEDNLKLSPEEHSLKRTEHLKREEFLKFLRFGWNLIQSYHVHPH